MTKRRQACARSIRLQRTCSPFAGFHRMHDTVRLVWMPSVGCRYALTPETSVCFNFAFCGRNGGAGGRGEEGGGGGGLGQPYEKKKKEKNVHVKSACCGRFL